MRRRAAATVTLRRNGLPPRVSWHTHCSWNHVRRLRGPSPCGTSSDPELSLGGPFMRHPHRLGAAMLAVLALAGCGRSTSPVQSVSGAAPTGSDQDQVATVVQQNPQYVNEDAWQSNLPQGLDGSGFAAIRPLRFWRTITSVTRSDDTQFGDPDSAGR